MALQSQQALALDALSVLSDVPPNPAQPVLKDGVHLRWVVGEDRSFPLKGGYYLFRRRVGGSDTPQQCVMPRLKDRDPVVVAAQNSINTGIGTLAANGDTVLKPRSIGPPGTPGIAAFTLDQAGLRFSLPAGTSTGSFTVRLHFFTAQNLFAAQEKPQGTIVIYRGATIVTRRIVVPPPDQQDITISVEGGADSIQISGSAAELVELCYGGKLAAPVIAPASGAAAQTTEPPIPGLPGPFIPGPGLPGPIRPGPVLPGPILPGPILPGPILPGPILPPNSPGPVWEIIPDLNAVIKLPLRHPQYPASAGAESINASQAIASARLRYDTWQKSFDAGTATQGNGTITLTNGSPLVIGSGTNWTADLVGSLIRLPLAGNDSTAYAVMAVLAADRIVLSRAWSGNTLNNATYQLVTGDDFAELHDRVASLLQSPNDMRAATVPPPLDLGSVAGGKCVLVSASAQVIGIGTQWTASLAGCWIEIGPAWFQSTYLAGSNIYRIQAVGAATQLTLDRPFSGVPSFMPAAKSDYRIFARADGDDPAGAPSFDFKPMDLLELASLMPGYAQALGLYGIDSTAPKAATFDYIVIADHQDLFSQQIGKALSWLNGTPDFTGDAVDGFIKFGVRHVGSPPLARPTQLELFRLPTAGARISIAHPDRADGDVGLSVLDAASWADPNATQVMPVMLNLWRLARGTNQANLTPVGSNAAGYDDLGRLLPSRRDSATAPNPPADWPANPIHFIDPGPDLSGLDVGWYSYRANAIDLFGRFSPDSAPIPWKNIDTSTAPAVDAIHLRDTTPPPPPAGALAWMLDDRDPYVVRDAAFQQWRNQFPASSSIVGLRLKFRWPWSHQNQGPDLSEFRVYFLDNPINARTGRVTSVSAVSGQPTRSLVTLGLDLPDNTSANAYQGASLQAGNLAFPILLSQSTTINQATSVQLTVENGGPSKTVMPESNVDGAIVIPSSHPLHRELLHPGYWKWLAAIPQNLAGTRYDIDMVEDSAAIPFDAELNSFTGAQATWNGAAFVLDAIPASHQLTSVRPGVDVLALSSDQPPGYYVMDIQSVQASGLRVVPKQLPDPVPLPATTFAWRIGPADAGLQGLAGSWNATARRFSLDGTPNLSNVAPGADLIYIAAAGATPANLNFFFAIQSLDAASRTLTLENTVNLNALPNGASFAWRIGRPVRHYEIFLPDPSVPQVNVTTEPSIQLAPAFNLLTPSLKEPIRHGTIGISSADKRTEVADMYWPSRGRTGNESFVSGPAPVFRVLRDPPPTPTYTWNVTRLLATRANYRDESFFTVRWNNPGAGYHAHVFRAMDSSLFLAHWKLSGALAVAGAPPGISVLSGFDARKASFTAHSAAAAAAEASSSTATFEAESALAQIDYREAARLYDQLDDVTLWWLAARPELADAYMQVTIKPLDLSDPANADRLGPDNDPGTFTASPAVRAYIDTLPGKSANRYFYAVMLLDSAQNRSALGGPTPPVYLPKVVPPRAPVISKVLGGDRQITIQWAPNREPDLAGYRVYRANDKDSSRDLRLMENVKDVAPGDVTYSDTVPGLIPLYYRLTAFDSAGNESTATPPVSGMAFDLSPPKPPSLNTAEWVKVDVSGAIRTWPEPVNPYTPAVGLVWSPVEAMLSAQVERRKEGMQLWALVSGSLDEGVQSYVDRDVYPSETYYYRIKVTNRARSTARTPERQVAPPQ
ncbi:fibronectin type III domain-containing protein [Bradyrhizobium sp.]